jgi:hypothetical protein
MYNVIIFCVATFILTVQKYIYHVRFHVRKKSTTTLSNLCISPYGFAFGKNCDNDTHFVLPARFEIAIRIAITLSGLVFPCSVLRLEKVNDNVIGFCSVLCSKKEFDEIYAFV